MFRCPSCQSTFVRPVPPAFFGRLRVRLTSKLLWECWHCGWRGWRRPDAPGGPKPPVPPEGRNSPAGRPPDDEAASPPRRFTVA